MNPSPISHLPSPNRVVGYIRGSTDEQINTLAAQRDQIEKYCAYKGLELAECFVDSGESGSTSFYERPQAAEMVGQMRDLGATAIVITKLDRGFRNALDCLFTVDNLQRQGIGLHLLDIQLDPDSPVGKLLLTMLAAIAEFENKRRSERQIAAFDLLRAQNKLCGTVPYGWAVAAVAGRGSELIPDAEEQRVLHQIVNWIENENLGVSTVARYLNQAGTPTKQGGKKWYPASVASVYRHRRLAHCRAGIPACQSQDRQSVAA